MRKLGYLTLVVSIHNVLLEQVVVVVHTSDNVQVATWKQDGLGKSWQNIQLLELLYIVVFCFEVVQEAVLTAHRKDRHDFARAIQGIGEGDAKTLVGFILAIAQPVHAIVNCEDGLA
mgnify:FL=1